MAPLNVDKNRIEVILLTWYIILHLGGYFHKAGTLNDGWLGIIVIWIPISRRGGTGLPFKWNVSPITASFVLRILQIMYPT